MIFNVNSGAGKIPINAVPNANSSFTYDGTTKTPLWQNYNSQQLSISGNTSGTNAGTYKVYFTPKSDYEWWDGTATPKEVSWSIAKAEGTLSLSATTGTIYEKTKTATFTVTRSGDGKITVKSGNTGVATVSVSGTTVTVTAVSYGSATITVSVAAGTNHTAPNSKTYKVGVESPYLYFGGSVNETITGGWQNLAKEYSGGTMGAQSLTVTNITGGIKLSQTGGGKGGLYVTKKKISLNNYQALRFTGTIYRDSTYKNRIGLVVLSEIGSKTEDNAAANFCANTGTTSFDDKTVLDLSGLSGSYYIGLYINSSDGKYIELKKLRLE